MSGPMPMREETATVAAIGEHYDRLSRYYKFLWGEHIHHGYWEGAESPAEAQIKLVEILVAQAGIARNSRVLDVGCGLGGSSLWLARNLDCEVPGITISPQQVAMAGERARAAGLSDRVTFEGTDANHLDLASESIDVVWVIEASEHLPDKGRFIEESGRVPRTGGTLALCAWLAAEDLTSPERLQLVEQVRRGMLCPSLASMGEYTQWMEAGGFEKIEAEDITRQVAKTWEHCSEIVRRPEVQTLLRVTDQQTRDFVAAFPAIRRAYEEGAMAYGMFAARKAIAEG